MSKRPLTFHLWLGAAGAAAGLAIWAVTGLGLVELGLTARFDPLGVAEEPPPATTFVILMEWSFGVFILLGAWLTPKFTAWLLVNPNTTPT